MPDSTASASSAVTPAGARFGLIRFRSIAFSLLPGVLLISGVAVAAELLGDYLGGSAMLYAMVLGLMTATVFQQDRLLPGVEFASRSLLRAGVAFLGFRLTYTDIADLGLPSLVLAASAVALTLLSGLVIGRCLRLSASQSVVCAGAVAICGAAAALAIAAVLPRDKELERHTILVVIGVTVLSTLAMVVYPMLCHVQGLSDHNAGILLGATIHDVAQVIGAGYAISEEAGDTAIIVKLMRISCLAPVVLIVAMIARHRGAANTSEARVSLIPGFLGFFLIITAINSCGWVSPGLASSGASVSQFLLIVGVSALGFKTSFASILAVGARPLALLVIQTVFLLCLATAALSLFRF